VVVLNPPQQLQLFAFALEAYSIRSCLFGCQGTAQFDVIVLDRYIKKPAGKNREELQLNINQFLLVSLPGVIETN